MAYLLSPLHFLSAVMWVSCSSCLSLKQALWMMSVNVIQCFPRTCAFSSGMWCLNENLDLISHLSFQTLLTCLCILAMYYAGYNVLQNMTLSVLLHHSVIHQNTFYIALNWIEGRAVTRPLIDNGGLLQKQNQPKSMFY